MINAIWFNQVFYRISTQFLKLKRFQEKILRMSIYSKEELLELLGKISPEQRKEIKLPSEINININEINRAIEIDKKEWKNRSENLSLQVSYLKTFLMN